MTTWLVDTGALVALLDRGDAHHAWARRCFRELHPPLLTCEAVLAECVHLLGDLPRSSEALARLHREGIVQCRFEFEAHASAVWKAIKKYADQPMDLADACLLRMTELHSDCRVWTVDRDFAVYRRHSRLSIPLLAPWQ